MKYKIEDNLNKGKYSKRIAANGYLNKNGWTDYLISEKIIFSHRMNDYFSGEFPEKLHSHDYYELTLIASGDGIEYIADGQSIAAGTGIAILTKPMQIHMFRLGTSIFYDRFVLYFKNIADIFPDTVIMDFTKTGNKSFAVFEVTEQLLSLLRTAEQILGDTASPYSSAKAYLNVCGLFAALSDRKPAAVSCIGMPNFISEIKEYIDENFLTIRSVGEVAEKYFYSREYISRCFRQYYNTPIYEYILNRKMLYCCTLLREGENVEAAAHRASFYNMPSFVKLFRKFNGCTPSEYKAKNNCRQNRQL